jgi:hypothetical protein
MTDTKDWRPESMRVLDEATERLMGILTPLLRLHPDEAASFDLSDALDDFVKAHMERRDEERREHGYSR